MDWAQRVYALVRQVPQGKVTTYKALAEALGCQAYQAVGQALHRNPTPDTVPCHRVVKTDGALGGYAWGVAQKRALLAAEGIVFETPDRVDLEQCFYQAW
ncbi:MGMT family protein [Thiomicrospira sp. WB1]|uniref:MGMT family protein n=1 Tax=Thiomicrospira sp. WB1 TaxID=1685380 RepID=UPI00074650DA|nr:MGMT family protein [Thiomicrospira sp. WB1]KUJ72349.1 cysteine methyltransferase [Thiomicrospira sp. WB1]